MAAADMGPTGHRVANNIRGLRADAGLSLRELEKRTEEAGWPVHSTGIMRMEKAARRVDTDELVSLALALDVAPNRLLLATGGNNGELDLTPGYTVPRKDIAWRWACGENRLPVPLSSGPSSAAEALQFMAKSRPHEVADYATNEAAFREHREHLAPIAKAARAALDADVPFSVILNYLRLSDAIGSAGEE